MSTHKLVLACVLACASCVGEVTDHSAGLELQLEAWSPDYLSGVATLGSQGVRFESMAEASDALLVTFDFGDLYVEYGAVAAEEVFWIDGYGGAMTPDHVALLHELAPALAAHISDDPAQRTAAEHMLGAAAAHLSTGAIDFTIAYKAWPIHEAADEVAYSYGDDGVKCIKPGRTYRIKFDWPGYSYSGDKTVATDGPHCGRLGYCGDCTFTTGTYALDCFEHDWCLKKAHNQGLPAIDASPWDYYCGDEWQEAANDFLLGYNWPYDCRS